MNLDIFRHFQSRFADLAKQTCHLAEHLGFPVLAEPCKMLMKRVREERFFVSVLGEIKRGKSSLINALLGADVLPKSSLVCTAALCVIKYGESGKAILYMRDGTSQEIPLEETARFVTKKNVKASELAHVEIDFPLPLLRDGIVIVDTPGVNDTDEVRRRITEEFIPRSDGVIFVLNAGQPLSHSEMQFLTDGVLKYHVKKIWFVINGIDRIQNEEQQVEAIDYCRTHLAQVLPEARVFPVSAKLALQGKLENDPEKIKTSRIDEFFSHFTQDLIESKRAGLFDVPLGLLCSVHEDLERGIRWSCAMLDQDSAKTVEQQTALEKELKGLWHQFDHMENRFFVNVEALVYEVFLDFGKHVFPDMKRAIRLILKADETDEQKRANLALFASGQIQCLAQKLVDQLHEKVLPVAEKEKQEMAALLAKVDSRIWADEPGIAMKQVMPELMVKPDLGIEGRGFVSTFGRLSTMVFLLQGNIFLAAISLAAFFATRLSESDTDRVHEQIQEHLDAACQRLLDQFLRERSRFAEGYRSLLKDQLRRGISLLEDVRKQSLECANQSKTALENRRTEFSEYSHQLNELKRCCSTLRQEVSG